MVLNHIDKYYEERTSGQITLDQVKINELENEWTIAQYKPLIDQQVSELIDNKNKLCEILEATLFWILKLNNFSPELSSLIVEFVRSNNEPVSLSLKTRIENILKDLSFSYDKKYLDDLTNIVALTIRKLGFVSADVSYVMLSVSIHIYHEVSKILEEKFRNILPDSDQSLNSLFENEEEPFPFFNEDIIHDLVMDGTRQVLRNWNIEFDEDTFVEELEKFHYINGEDSDFRLIIDPFPWYS